MDKTVIPYDLKKLQPFWGEWVIESYIGGGAFGQVYRIVRKKDPQEYKAGSMDKRHQNVGHF